MFGFGDKYTNAFGAVTEYPLEHDEECLCQQLF